jgi:hypothetical protein
MKNWLKDKLNTPARPQYCGNPKIKTAERIWPISSFLVEYWVADLRNLGDFLASFSRIKETVTLDQIGLRVEPFDKPREVLYLHETLLLKSLEGFLHIGRSKLDQTVH